MPKGIEVIPSARRLSASLRSMGYEFPTAVAELVDNSITAGARKVHINVEFAGENSWVQVADNGRGMTRAALIEAMRYGSTRAYDTSDLGKFGLGLKTASLSQCERLTVASRAHTGRSSMSAFYWDMKHIEKTDRWEILPLRRDELHPSTVEFLGRNTGTVVLWQRLERMLGFANEYGDAARKRLLAMTRDLEQHLAMVFHRFLAGEVRGQKLEVRVNNNVVQPWDPFARSEPKTRALEAIELTVSHGGVEGKIVVEPYVLPHQTDFSSPAAFRGASGPANWNQQQGFYVYRANRLIQSGGWSKLRTIDEHTKLARVALRFVPILDNAFEINVSKMRVSLPAQLRASIDSAVKPVIKAAQETYRKGNSRSPSTQIAQPSQTNTSGASNSGSGAATGTEAGTRSGGTARTRDQTWTLDEIEKSLLHIAHSSEMALIRSLMARLRQTITNKEIA